MNSLEQRLGQLQEKARSTADAPGVYRMLDKDGKVLYVGKAKSLTNRVRTYFQKVDDPKTRALVSRIHDFEVILTRSEAEALILESILIKKHKPRYNIALKDDKSFPYVVVDESHSFPKLVYMRRPRKRKGLKIYGPFASAFALREALRVLNHTFKLRDCSDAEFANRSRPCLNYQIGICSGSCTGQISQEQYRADVEKALAVLSGRGNEVIAKLEEDMEKFSIAQEYEQAARVRDQLSALLETIKKRRARGDAIERSSRDMSDRDVIGLYRKPDAAAIVVLFVRMGDLVDTASFHFDGIEGRTDQELLSQFLAQFYLTDDKLDDSEERPASGGFAFPGAEAKTVPGEIILPMELPELGLLQESLQQLGHSVAFHCPERGVKSDLLDLASRNAENVFDERQREKGSIYRVLAELKAKLRLENYPRRIECFDISNLGDTGIVASRVTFIEGKADKSLYRHYKIRSSSSQNDFAAMREVIERRLLKTVAEGDGFEEPPDLLVIDGGKGQLSMAVEVIRELNITGLDVVSLAKARSVGEEEQAAALSEGREIERAFERVFKPGRMNPILLAPDSAVCHLMQRIRDEAHRFAVEFQRKQRTI